MAAPVYASDLADIITDMSGTTGWTLITDGGGGANSLTAPETDDFVQGSNCISRNPWTSANIRGMVYNSSQTVAAGNAVWFWIKADVAQALRTKANGGIQALIGDGTGSLKCYYTDGSDTYVFGGWRCIPVDPTVTPSTTVGSPGSTTSYFGARWAVATSGPSKGFPYKIDAIRRGRTLTATDGDSGNGYATFTGAADWQVGTGSGDISRQYGQFQLQNGVYRMQGLFRMGTSGTSVDFRDSNRAIFISNTEYVGSAFNGFEVNHASSVVQWTNISVAALGTVSRGNFTVNNNANVTLTDCTLTDMGTFALGSNTLATGTTFRRCGTITLNGATLTSCLITNGREAQSVSAATLNNMTGCTFVSDGSNHAVNLGTVSSSASMTWANTLSGYAGSNGSTGNEAILVNVASGQTLTINVSAGASTPSIYNTGSGTVSVVSGTVNYTLTVTNAAGTAVSGARVFVRAASGGALPVDATVTISNSGTTATVSHTGHAMATGDKVRIRFVSDTGKIAANEGVFTITKINDNSYSYTMGSSPGASPTGTIRATYVLLDGATDVNGQVTGSRSFASNQPVTGWARKSTSAPFYKQGPVTGTITTASGGTLSAVLISDE